MCCCVHTVPTLHEAEARFYPNDAGAALLEDLWQESSEDESECQYIFLARHGEVSHFSYCILNDFVCNVTAAAHLEDCAKATAHYLLRVHLQTVMNAAGRLQGKGINAPLNEEGQQQANGLGRFLSKTHLHIVCSSLDRYD
jgi:Histidine phosphatase superfamily (branch 1)